MARVGWLSTLTAFVGLTAVPSASTRPSQSMTDALESDRAEPVAAIDTIIFDLGGVVVGRPPWHDVVWASWTLRANPLAVAQSLPNMMAPVTTGASTEAAALSSFVAAHGGTLPADWRERLQARYRATVPVRQDVVVFVEALRRRGFSVPLLSNTIPAHAEVDRARGIHQLFSPVFLSFEMGLKKPDPAIFSAALQQLARRPAVCVFVDDRQENVDAARALGMHGLLFSDLPTLRQELALLGVTTSPACRRRASTRGTHHENPYDRSTGSQNSRASLPFAEG